LQCRNDQDRPRRGELGGMTVYHNPNGIANMLSLKSVAEEHRVTYDS
jgi:hypothetical protein